MEENKEKIELIKKSFELKHLNKFKEALVLLYKALEYDDYNQDNVELLSQIGQLHILLGNYERALEEFERALAIQPNHNFSLQKCYEIYYLLNQPKKAFNLAQKMFEQDKNPLSCYCYIESLIKNNNIQDAIEVFNLLDETLKLDSNILYLISTAYEGDKKEAVLKRIIELDDSHTKANLDLAEIEFKRKNYDEVIKYCVNIEEDNAIALYYLGVIEAKRNNYTRAIELIQKAIEIDNGEHDFYLDLAKAYIDSSLLNEALFVLKKSINLSLAKNKANELDEKYFLTGWILIKQNELSKALLNLSSVNEKSEFYSQAQILIQAINLKKLNLSSAKSILEDYLEKNQDENNNPILLDTLALVYKELKLYKNAILTFKKALSYYPESIYYKLEIIDLLIDDKNYDEAIKLINDIKIQHENCAAIYNSLARIYYRLKNYDSALESINLYIKLDNNNAEAHYFKGLILNDMYQFEEAKKTIYNAIKLSPDCAKYYYQMARSYKELKEYENALLYSKEAIEIDQNEINYKKQAYEIALALGDEKKIQLFKNQLKRSEEILKLNR